MCMNIKIRTDSGDGTKEIGSKLGSLVSDNLNSGNIVSRKIAIALYGDLGSGKTTFVQGFGRGLGVGENYYITSPTYNIINEYPAGLLTLYHIDLYRLGSPDELEYIGFDDIAASDKSAIIIEWPDIIDIYNKKILVFDMEIRIEIDREFNREISFIPYGLDAINLLKQFA